MTTRIEMLRDRVLKAQKALRDILAAKDTLGRAERKYFAELEEKLAQKILKDKAEYAAEREKQTVNPAEIYAELKHNGAKQDAALKEMKGREHKHERGGAYRAAIDLVKYA